MESRAFKNKFGFELDDIYDVDLEIDGGYPEFDGSYLITGFVDGRELTDEEADYINDNCTEWVYDQVIDRLM